MLNMEGLQEFIVLNPSQNRANQGTSSQESSTLTSQSRTEIVVWSYNATLTLIDLYKQFRNKVGTMEIRNMKRLWEILATKLNTIHDTNFSPYNCENRWRVIERNYKKYVDDSHKTGAGRKFFEYAKEMEELFGKKRNINPELLLSSSTIDHLQEKNTSILQKKNVEAVDIPTTSRVSDTSSLASRQLPSTTRQRTIVQKRNLTLELMRTDKKEYYEKLLNIQKEKLQFEKEKCKEKMDLEKLRLQIKESKNEMNKERNEILRQYLQNNIPLPEELI